MVGRDSRAEVGTAAGTDEGGGQLGAFGGVFAPSILTILGIIFYLRTGFVVGQVGLLDTLIIITFAYVISALTSLSLSAVATSMKVKGGGFYYVISRTLGFEFGGALGLVLFLSISIGIAFYAIGLGEVVVDNPLVPGWVTPRHIAVVVILFLFGFAWAGADVATRLQYVVMAIVFASILAIGWGGLAKFDTGLVARNTGSLFSSAGGEMGFWTAFALFFPAITGFTQGLNMSGDLGRPTRDIPLGTLGAVGLSYLLYLGVALILAGTAAPERLRDDYLVLEAVAPAGWIVTAGVIAATASSAMASFLGAPRIAQALGRDDVFPYSPYLAKGAGPADNPRRAVVLSGAIALGAVAIGNLNFLAPIITMFFLASYALLNYATFYVAYAASPSFRPSFRAFHRYLSLVGGLACIGAMLAINVTAAVVAVFAIVALHQYLQSRATRAEWADSQRAFKFRLIRQELFELDERPAHPRDWRPQVLVFSKHAPRRRDLLHFAQWIEANAGLTTVVSVVEDGDGDGRDPDAVRDDLLRWIEAANAQAFALAVSAPDFRTGLSVLLQSYGVGPLKANTLVFNWLDQEAAEDGRGQIVYGRNLRLALEAGHNVVVLAAHDGVISDIAQNGEDGRRIDIWWVGGRTGGLMLLLGHLNTRMSGWEEARLRVLAEGRHDHPEETERRIREMLDEVNITAEVEIVEATDVETIVRCSADATLTYFPAQVDDDHFRGRFGVEMTAIAEGVPAVAFCVAGEEIELDKDPDDIDEEERRKLRRKSDENGEAV